jgi:hypothetical protein
MIKIFLKIGFFVNFSIVPVGKPVFQKAPPDRPYILRIPIPRVLPWAKIFCPFRALYATQNT